MLKSPFQGCSIKCMYVHVCKVYVTSANSLSLRFPRLRDNFSPDAKKPELFCIAVPSKLHISLDSSRQM